MGRSLCVTVVLLVDVDSRAGYCDSDALFVGVERCPLGVADPPRLPRSNLLTPPSPTPS